MVGSYLLMTQPPRLNSAQLLPKEQGGIAEARRLHEAGQSLRAVARDLDRRSFVSRLGKTFLAEQVKRMLEGSLDRGDFVATTTKSPRKIGLLPRFTGRHDVATTMTTT